MESILGVVQSPVFIGLLVFLGMVSLVRILLVSDPDMKRASRDDRRCSQAKMPEYPFHDSEGVLVTQERRVQADRRRSRLQAMKHDMEEDSITG